MSVVQDQTSPEMEEITMAMISSHKIPTGKADLMEDGPHQMAAEVHPLKEEEAHPQKEEEVRPLKEEEVHPQKEDEAHPLMAEGAPLLMVIEVRLLMEDKDHLLETGGILMKVGDHVGLHPIMKCHKDRMTGKWPYSCI